MTKKDKLLQKLLSRTKTFTYDELKTLLSGSGYDELAPGKTSGLRVGFYNKSIDRMIRLHKPHPSNQLKRYQIDYLIDELKNIGVLK